MSSKLHALNRLSLVAAIAVLLVAAPAVHPASTGHRDAGIGTTSSHVVNRALKADRFAKPQVIEPATAPQPDVRSSGIKIGCERPFSAMVTIRSDLPGRCLASMTREDSIRA